MQNPHPSSPRAEAAGATESLRRALDAVARSQGIVLDSLRLREALARHDARQGLPVLDPVLAALGYEAPARHVLPERSRLPMLVHLPERGWGVVVDRAADGHWVVDFGQDGQDGEAGEGGEGEGDRGDGIGRVNGEALRERCAELRLSNALLDPIGAEGAARAPTSFSAVLFRALRAYHGCMGEALLASLFIGLLALATSLFSMQVYDRVIPTKGEYTLIVLSVGVSISILLELTMKFARSHLMDHVAVGLDNQLSPAIFQRLMSLRLDQLPGSVGSLVSQLRGYEQVRGFYTASTLFTLIDLPLGVLFLVVMVVIASPVVAVVPLTMGALALTLGILGRRHVLRLAAQGAQLSNMRTGLLVEAVEGVETIKSGSGGWKFLSRWTRINAITIQNDMRMKSANERTHYLAGAIQQAGYTGVIVVGALLVMHGDMTTGSLIACSILSGRVITPILSLPGLIVQYGHARAALDGLNKFYELKTDNHGVERVIIPERLHGAFRLEGVKFAYRDNPPALTVPGLEIGAGERIGVLGPIGSGKSTLLRLLGGLYVPTGGRVMVDGLDLSHVSREVINRQIGYLQQEHRLFQGTLRENLLIGLPDPGDERLRAVMRRTGLDQVVRSHPKGLDRVIVEGGQGLSGGQRQLLAFTRLLLADFPILLLDEPTGNMDQEQEKRCLDVLMQETRAGKTMVIVTHKTSLLPLVERLMVVNGNRIVLDGPRDDVLARFSGRPAAPPIPQPVRSIALAVNP